MSIRIKSQRSSGSQLKRSWQRLRGSMRRRIGRLSLWAGREIRSWSWLGRMRTGWRKGWAGWGSWGIDSQNSQSWSLLRRRGNQTRSRTKNKTHNRNKDTKQSPRTARNNTEQRTPRKNDKSKNGSSHKATLSKKVRSCQIPSFSQTKLS